MTCTVVFAVCNRHSDYKFKRLCKRICDLCLLEVVGGRTNKNYIVLDTHTDMCSICPIICVKCVWLLLKFRASAKTSGFGQGGSGNRSCL